jgi:colanic acid biosynthesis glycosyl transferase WcaI
MLHILLLSQYFPPDVNGSSTRSFNLAKALVSQGSHVTVISTFPHYPKPKNLKQYGKKLLVIENMDGIKIIRVKIPNLLHYPYYKRILLHLFFCFSSLIGIIYVKKIDVIFAMNPSFFVALPALIYKILFHKKIIRNVDDLWPEVFYDLKIIQSNFLKKILDFFSQFSYNISSAIIPISEGYVTTLVEKYKISKTKIHVIEHGVDITKFNVINETRIKNSQKVIMYSGAINIGYDFDPVIQAAKLLESQHISFVIRGTGDMVDELGEMIKKYGVTNVTVNTELLEKTKLISLLKTADIFLLPMAFGVIDSGLPTKLLEYQALGKPIICISDGEAGNYIQKTHSGLVARNKDPKQISELILKLIKDENLAKQLGKNGHDYINKNLTLQSIGKRLVSIIDTL